MEIRSGKKKFLMVFAAKPQVHVLASFSFVVRYCRVRVQERSRDSSVIIVTMLCVKLSEVWFSGRAEDFSLSQASTLASRPTQPPVQWISVVLSQRLKEMGRDTHHWGVIHIIHPCFVSGLVLCRQTTYKNMSAIPCIVDGSCLSTFSYTMSYMCLCQLAWLIYCFKVISSLMQDIWVSSYKQTDWSWPAIFRTIKTATNRPLIQILSLFSFSSNHGFA
jgi:hypothetical protein